MSFAPESDGKSKTREPDHDYKEKGRVFQQNTGKIHPSTESRNGSQKTSKVSDGKCNTKKPDRDAEIYKKLKRLFSPEPDTDHESNIVNGRQLQETRNRHLEKDSGRLQTTGVRSSVSSGVERPLHKAKSNSERRADRDAEIHKKLKRLFSPEPEKEGASVRLEKKEDRSSMSFAPESDGKSKTREPDHDKEKGRVFQQNTGKSRPSTESRNGSQKTSKVSDGQSNTKKKDRDAEIHKKLKRLFSPEPDTDHESNIVNGRQLQETRNRHQKEDGGRLANIEDRPSISFAPEKRESNLGEETQ
nr:U1 small nuclear ribonucleoprotein 70 kDa-like [Leptinotarsa decemlineata]